MGSAQEIVLWSWEMQSAYSSTPPSRKLSFNGIPLPVEARIKFLGMYFEQTLTAPEHLSMEYRVQELAKGIGSRGNLLHSLRSPSYGITFRTMKSIFQRWIWGEINYTLPMLVHLFKGAELKLETSYRMRLRATMGLSGYPPSAVLYEISEFRPMWHMRNTQIAFTSLWLLLATFDDTMHNSQAFWKWIESDSSYRRHGLWSEGLNHCTSSTLAELRGLLLALDWISRETTNPFSRRSKRIPSLLLNGVKGLLCIWPWS